MIYVDLTYRLQHTLSCKIQNKVEKYLRIILRPNAHELPLQITALSPRSSNAPSNTSQHGS